MATPTPYSFGQGANQSLPAITVSDVAGNVSNAAGAQSGINQDTVAPVLSAAINAAASTGLYNLSTGAAVVTYTATDAGPSSGVATPTPYSFGQGANQSLPAITVSDVAGNVSNATGGYSGINVYTVSPTVVAPNNITSGPTDSTGATVNYTGGSASDVGGSGIATTVFNPVSGSHFLVGTSTATYTATDKAGNSTSANFTVTVNPAGFIGSVLYIVGTSSDNVFVINATTVAATTVTLGGNPVPGSPFNLTGKTVSALQRRQRQLLDHKRHCDQHRRRPRQRYVRRLWQGVRQYLLAHRRRRH